MRWSHNDQWMITGDHAGFVKYWQTNMNNVKMYQGHKEPIRSLRWDIAPTCGSFQLVSKIKQCFWIDYNTSKDAEACHNVAIMVFEYLTPTVCEMQKYLYLTKYALLFLLLKFSWIPWTWICVCNLLHHAACNMQKYLYLTKYVLLFLSTKLSWFPHTLVGFIEYLHHTAYDVQKYLYLTNYALLFLVLKLVRFLYMLVSFIKYICNV